MKSLILAEKPSVARDLANVLGCNQKNKQYIEGPRYVVTWALGHLVELKMPEDYDKKYETWRMEDLPIIPDRMGLKTIRKTSPQLKAIDRLVKRKDVQEVIIATDAGREGELVARWILKRIQWKGKVKRLWISSQTDRAICDGFRQLKPAAHYDNLFQSAVCRAEADWLIGLNVTRALTTKYNDPLSAGRVQTPTLGLVLDRERAIQSFKPEPYWLVKAAIGPITAQWQNKKGEKRLFGAEEAERLKQKISGRKATVTDVRSKQKTERQPLPYDLTELQRDANKIFGFSAKKTSNVLQGLYERHKIVTYPRTDSKYLTQDMKATMAERVKAIASAYADEVRPIAKQQHKVLANHVFNDAKVTDHHAIIPTDETVYAADLDSDEKKLFDLIAKRFLALFYSPYEYDTVEAVFDVDGEMFSAKETIVREPGFKRLRQQDEETNRETAVVQKGQSFQVKNVVTESKMTEPPPRYSESDLLGRMEKYGLGTPATRADIIEKLVFSEAIERKNGKLFPTPKGKQLIELVNDELKSPKLTARWEAELESIARGKGNAQAFLKNIREQAHRLVSEVAASKKTYRAHNLTGTKCPECGELMKERKTKDGKMLVCANRECGYRKRREAKLTKRRCPQCKKRMEIHKGEAGVYFQCRPCNVVEKADRGKKVPDKREKQRLMKKYEKKEPVGNSMADALKAALEKKE
ncbi:MAG TPA: DNA topoisomerase III [Bacillales bacterium]|nr:DNA topoisomerase III [Bacillales bacterium]